MDGYFLAFVQLEQGRAISNAKIIRLALTFGVAPLDDASVSPFFYRRATVVSNHYLREVGRPYGCFGSRPLVVSADAFPELDQHFATSVAYF
jgi:hypothetical protein